MEVIPDPVNALRVLYLSVIRSFLEGIQDPIKVT